MCAAVDFVVAGRTCNGGNQVWRFDTGTAQSSQPDMCQYRRFRIAITYARDSYLAFQERMAEHIRYMVETIAHHQVDIDSEV